MLLTEQADNAQATRIAEFSVNCDSHNQDKFISPNENWLAIHCIRKLNPTLEIVNREGKRWVLQLKDYVSKKYVHDEGAGMGGFHPEKWTNDGEYLYFSSALYSSGGYVCFYDLTAQGLYRIKLNDGTVSAILPAEGASSDYTVSFSPTDRRLAYQGNGDLIIRDLQTSNEFTIGVEGTVGNLT